VSIKPSFFEWDKSLIASIQDIPINHLLSQCIVGSHLEAKNFRAIHDVDICVILEYLDCKLLLDLYAQFTILANKLSSNTLSIFLETRGGPIKPTVPAKGHYNIQLHLIIHDLATWEKIVGYPGCNRWIRNNRHIRGKQLASLTTAPKVSTAAICRDLRIAVENITTATAYCKIYDLSGDHVLPITERVPLCYDQYVQILLHAAICGFENTTDPYMGGKALHSVAPIVKEKYSKLYHFCVRLKHQINEGDTISFTYTNKIKKDILVMLEDLVYLASGGEMK